MLKQILFLFINIVLLHFTFSEASEVARKVEILKGKIKIGGRLQAIFAQDNSSKGQDLYLRRTRVNLKYRPWKGHVFVYDVRNDGANKADYGEKKYVVGDAFWKIQIKNKYINNIKLFRAKVDVSYSQTSSSRNLLNPERAEISEHASDFVVQNRRAVNAQFNGNINQLAYQAILSDGVNSDDLEALNGNSISKVNHQKLTYGTKLRYYFFGDASKNKLQDTFYGLQNLFSLGIGHFINDKINVDNSNNTTLVQEFSFKRSLTNIDLSIAYRNLRILAEYFRFTGDLIDLNANNKNEILGGSGGYYAQAEYLFAKWAPYIIYEDFDKNKKVNDAVQIVTTFGLNYYHMQDSMRFGVAYKKIKNGLDVGNNTAESIFGYSMLNF